MMVEEETMDKAFANIMMDDLERSASELDISEEEPSGERWDPVGANNVDDFFNFECKNITDRYFKKFNKTTMIIYTFSKCFSKIQNNTIKTETYYISVFILFKINVLQVKGIQKNLSIFLQY